MKNWTSKHRKEVKGRFFVGNYAIDEKFIEIKKKLLLAKLGANNNVSVRKKNVVYLEKDNYWQYNFPIRKKQI